MSYFTPANIRMWSRLGSCGAHAMAMGYLAENDKSIIAMEADLGVHAGLDRFRRSYPENYVNVGISEQNMIAVAAGMASEGYKVFASTFASFASARPLDQIRVNMGYMQLPVKLMGLTAGLSAGFLGATHLGTEDMAIIRSIPNITILSPADSTETVKAVLAAAESDKPVYIRLTGTMGSPVVYKEDYDYRIGKGIKLRDGSDAAIIATGTMVAESLKAAEALSEQGISASVIDIHTIRPLDGEMIRQCLDCKLIVTAEEHSITGGLGSAVAEEISPCAHKPPQLLIGLPSSYPDADSYEAMLEKYGLTAEKIAGKIAEFMKQ